MTKPSSIKIVTFACAGCSWKADNMEYWWCFYSGTDTRYQPEYCLWFAAGLPSCVLVQRHDKCWQLSLKCTTTDVQDIGCWQHTWLPASCHLFIYSSWTIVWSLPVVDWQLAETAVYSCFKIMHRLDLLVACWLQNNCTVCSVYVILTLYVDQVRFVIYFAFLSLIHIWRCRRSTLCRSRWSPYH